MNLTDESAFRWAFGGFLLLNFVIRIYFQARAQNPRKSYVRHEQRARRGFTVLALAYLLLIVYPVSTLVDFAHVGLPAWFRWTFGGALLLVYLLLFAWAHQVLGKHWSGLLEIHEDHTLITTGPYRAMRHPMYSAFFLSAIGYFFLSANWCVASVYLLAVGFMYFDRVSAEEAMMLERFGDAYRAYQARTGSIVPRFHRLRAVQHRKESVPPTGA